MEEFLNLPFVGTVVLVVMCLNIALGAAKGILDVVKDKTETQWDNKAAEILGKVLGPMGKIIDWLRGNRPASK